MKRYSPKDIEPKWQKKWLEDATYSVDLNSKKPKYMASGMFNYPSGAGIHIGHGFTFTIPDVKARFKRQLGYESLNPVGWDAFGLPAENYAIKQGISPQESMAGIIPNYRKQYTAMGWGNDWQKEIDSSQPEYYKWTQWIFSQMHKNKLAYQDARMQWWCTKCQTVLANEQIDSNGKCWRHDGPDDLVVEKKEVKQWFFKITEYADELLEAVEDLNWTESVKLAQKNWIGRSVGAEIVFKVAESEEQITVFTTRPDTLFGVTFMVVAPESDVVAKITTEQQKAAVEAYVKESTKKTEVERQASKIKTGVFTGSYAVNPANNQKIPIWVADYVLGGYGTGAIMAVPAHDERDYDFAKKYDLPVQQVVEPLYIQSTDAGKVREDKDFVERQAITAIVKHWSEDKYLGLKWKKVDWDTFLTGGVDEGQTAEEAAIREIREETGYLKPKLIKQLSNTHAQFFHVPKDENRFAHFSDFYFELEDDSREEMTAEEQGNHDLVWLTKEEMAKFRLPESHRFIWDELISGSVIYSGEGIMANSGAYSGMSSSDAREKIVADLAKEGLAQEKVNYKMRDWSVSRQRYWGAPIPIINCQKCGPVLVPDEDLPVVLPELDDFRPSGDGRSALARASEWLKVDCPKCASPAERETDTLDTFIDSSWYLYRYIDPHNNEKIFDSKLVNKWFPVDFYDGGDHATAHLLYARFVARFFNKIGLVDEPEPFKQMLFHGKVLASDGSFFSKSKGNGIDPLEIIEQGYGADALRTYLLFAAPPELDARWNPQGVPGTFRFLNRLWTLVQEYTESKETELSQEISSKINASVHSMIKKVTEDIEKDSFNTAIAALMQAVNELYKYKAEQFGRSDAWQQALEYIVACTAPFAPHITEELWQDLGHKTTVHIDTWPKWEDKYLISDTMKIVIQVNGKVRSNIELPADASEEEVLKAAQADKKVAAIIGDNSVKKSIYIAKKLVNFVI
jgi:leucyl-tRNA synthetase